MSYNSVEDYVKNAESNRNPAVLNSLLESEPGMKELPEITAEDEGKILQVNNGEPSWSSGSSGGGVLVVHMVYDEEKDNDYTDKTWKEIHDAPMAVIVEESSLPFGVDMRIRPIARVYSTSSEYSVVYYEYAQSTPGEYTIEEVKLVTDSENGYLTWAE